MENYNPWNGDGVCFLYCLALPGIQFVFFWYFADGLCRFDNMNEKNALACVWDGRMSVTFHCRDCILVYVWGVWPFMMFCYLVLFMCTQAGFLLWVFLPHPSLVIYLTKSVPLDSTSDSLKPCIFAPHMGNVQSMSPAYIHLPAGGDLRQGWHISGNVQLTSPPHSYLIYPELSYSEYLIVSGHSTTAVTCVLKFSYVPNS